MIGAVAFFVAVTIAALTYVFAIMALAIDAHRAGVGILIISISYISPIGIVLNGAVMFRLAFACANVRFLCTCYTMPSR